MSDLRKAKVDNKIIEVVGFDAYIQNRALYPQNYTGVTIDENYVYPVRGKNDLRPGVYYQNKSVTKIVTPSNEEEKANYASSNIIDFTNLDNMKQVMDKQNELKGMERVILTTPDNIFTPKISEKDSAELVVLKQAVIAKHIDIDKYEHRFGNNFNNDKRLFDRTSITLPKLVSMCNNLDMKATLIIEDANPEVPNPMGTVIKVELTNNWSEE